MFDDRAGRYCTMTRLVAPPLTQSLYLGARYVCAVGARAAANVYTFPLLIAGTDRHTDGRTDTGPLHSGLPHIEASTSSD